MQRTEIFDERSAAATKVAVEALGPKLIDFTMQLDDGEEQHQHIAESNKTCDLSSPNCAYVPWPMSH